MDHLNRTELMLYQKKVGISLEQRQIFEQHLKLCERCRAELAALEQQLNHIAQENLTACQQFQQHLLPYLDGELKDKQAQALKNHLEECNRCQQLYQLAADLPDWDDPAAVAIAVPIGTQETIERAVVQALKTASRKEQLRDRSRKTVAAIEGMVAEFILSFRPIQPAAVFRGNGTDELKVIEHPGGDLHLATGLKNVTLELTSIFEEFMLKGQTDENGEIVFKNLAKGEYIASVSGYRLTEVKIRS